MGRLKMVALETRREMTQILKSKELEFILLKA